MYVTTIRVSNNIVTEFNNSYDEREDVNDFVNSYDNSPVVVIQNQAHFDDLIREFVIQYQNIEVPTLMSFLEELYNQDGEYIDFERELVIFCPNPDDSTELEIAVLEQEEDGWWDREQLYTFFND